MEGFGSFKLVWSLSVPNKVKNFLWRVCKEALPMKRNLRRRKIIEEDTCDHCKSNAKSEFHALWECLTLASVWNSVPELQLHHDQNVHTISDSSKSFMMKEKTSICLPWSFRQCGIARISLEPLMKIIQSAKSPRMQSKHSLSITKETRS